MQSYGRPLMGVTRVQTSLIIILLAFLSFYSRLAFLNREVLDWDETTFMLMAQDVLRGNLPYVHIFDNKPPGMFFILAAAMKLFGQRKGKSCSVGATCRPTIRRSASR